MISHFCSGEFAAANTQKDAFTIEAGDVVARFAMFERVTQNQVRQET